MASFWENLQVDGQDMQLYASVPSSSGGFSPPHPAVVIAHPASGVAEFTQSIADRLGRGRLRRSRPRPLPPGHR